MSEVKEIKDLNIKLFADGADVEGILNLNNDPLIKGFTTNPTLMKAAGITNYEDFAKTVLKTIKDKPISFEVFADDYENIVKQAEKIATWQDNVNVKIPIMNTKGEFSGKIIEKLSMQNISLNITAIMTSEQVKKLLDFLNPNSHSIISVFAGRIADTGVDPEEVMRTVKELLKNHSNAELLWASPRELYNIYQAENCDCDIITIPHALTKKFSVINKDLIEYSKETVEMFYNDALESNFNIDT